MYGVFVCAAGLVVQVESGFVEPGHDGAECGEPGGQCRDSAQESDQGILTIADQDMHQTDDAGFQPRGGNELAVSVEAFVCPLGFVLDHGAACVRGRWTSGGECSDRSTAPLLDILKSGKVKEWDVFCCVGSG